MLIEIKEKELLDLLAECLPVLEFALGGRGGVEGLIAKVEMVLRLSARPTGDEGRP